MTRLLNAETGIRGYMLTGDPVFAEPFDSATRELPAALEQLQKLVNDNPEQQAQARLIAAKAGQLMTWHGDNHQLVRDGAVEKAVSRAKTLHGKMEMDNIRGAIDTFVQEEQRLDHEREEAVRRSRQGLQWMLIAGTAVTLFSTVCLAIVFSRGISGRLATLTENSDRLKRGKELAVRLTGTDEIAQLDHAFHDMAAELARKETVLRQTLERFRLLVENAVDYALILLDPSGKVESWNVGAERIKGYRADEIIGKHFSCFYPSEMITRGWPEQELRVASAEGRFEDEGWRIRKDGSRFWANVVITALRDQDGRLRGFSKLSRDLTERKRAEEEIQKLNDELEHRVDQRTAELAEANRDLAHKNQENEMFVYSVSHDLRSPLVNLEGFSKELSLVSQEIRGILLDHDLPPAVTERGLALLDGDMAESIRFIQTGVMRLSGIIDALLRLSRAGKVEYQLQQVEVRPIVARVVEALSGTISGRNATVTIGELPPVFGDPTAVEQIFANLIGNAVNYLDARRPGLIEVGSLGCRGGNGSGWHTFYVKDNGLGIDEAYKAKIFKAFQRVHPGVAKGEGMGLTVVHRIVERLGGKIWFESVEGAGTTFFVTLPIAQENVRATRMPRGSQPMVLLTGDNRNGH